MPETNIVLLSETFIDRELLIRLLEHLDLCYEGRDYDSAKDGNLSIDESFNDGFITALKDAWQRDEFIKYSNNILNYGYDDEDINTKIQSYIITLGW